MHKVQVVVGEIIDGFVIWPLDPNSLDVPLVWHCPIEYLSTARSFLNIERNDIGQKFQGLTDTVASDAASDGVQLP